MLFFITTPSLHLNVALNVQYIHIFLLFCFYEKALFVLAIFSCHFDEIAHKFSHCETIKDVSIYL